MKTIRSYSVPAFSIMLLLSCAGAQSMDRAFVDIDNAVGSQIQKAGVVSAIRGGIASSGNYIVEKAKAGYAALPTKQQAGVMFANAADELSFQLTAQGGYVRQHPTLTKVAGAAVVGAAVVGTGVKVYNMQKMSQLLKAIDAELDATYNALTNGTIHEYNLEALTASLNNGAVKNALVTFNNAVKLYNHTAMEDVTTQALRFAYNAAKYEVAVALKGEKSVKAEKAQAKKAAFLANVEEVTKSFGAELQRKLAARKVQGLAKVAGDLGFENALVSHNLVNWIPAEYPKLAEAWRQFGFAAVEYDRASNDDQLGSLVDAMDRVFDEIESLATSKLEKAKNAAVNAAVSAKDIVVSKASSVANSAVNAGVVAKNAVVTHPKTSGSVAALATGAVVAKTGLVGKSIAFFNSLDKRAIMNGALDKTAKVVTLAKNNKGKLGAAGAIATGAYGLYKLHSFLGQDATFSEVAPAPAQPAVVVAQAEATEPIVAAPAVEAVEPVDSNGQMAAP